MAPLPNPRRLALLSLPFFEWHSAPHVRIEEYELQDLPSYSSPNDPPIHASHNIPAIFFALPRTVEADNSLGGNDYEIWSSPDPEVLEGESLFTKDWDRVSEFPLNYESDTEEYIFFPAEEYIDTPTASSSPPSVPASDSSGRDSIDWFKWPGSWPERKRLARRDRESRNI